MPASLKNERGFTLIELIAVMVISVVLILISATVLSTFYRRYKSLNDMLELQKGAMKCLSVIKNGYPMNRGEQFYGVTNAKTLEITGRGGSWNSGTGIKVTPPQYTDAQRNDMVHFYLEDNAIKVKYIYNGVEVNAAQYLFPERSDRERTKVTRFEVINANQAGQLIPLNDIVDTDLHIIEVILEAQVLVRNNPLASKREYKKVDYRTFMVMK